MKYYNKGSIAKEAFANFFEVGIVIIVSNWIILMKFSLMPMKII